MTPFWLQKFNSRLGLFRFQSVESIENESVFLNFTFTYAEKLFRWLVLFWLIYQLGIYISLSTRPVELFIPMNWISRLVMPTFPASGIYIGIVLLAAICNIISMFGRGNIATKSMLAISVWYLNILTWSYGHFSHSGHLFVLTNLFLVFVPAERKGSNLADRAGAIRWMYIGLMVTYSMAGFWKMLGLIARFTVSREGISWLNPDAALYNAVSGFRSWDLPLDNWMIHLFTIPYIWPVLVAAIFFIQLISVLVTIRIPLFYWIGFSTVAFHIFNTVFMKIEFILAPLILLILFFPYHLLLGSLYRLQLNPVREYTYSGNGLTAMYIRQYNNQKDVYTGFYALRERYLDEKKWFAGWFYLPGLSILVSLVWKLFGQKNKETSVEISLLKQFVNNQQVKG